MEIVGASCKSGSLPLCKGGARAARAYAMSKSDNSQIRGSPGAHPRGFTEFGAAAKRPCACGCCWRTQGKRIIEFCAHPAFVEQQSSSGGNWVACGRDFFQLHTSESRFVVAFAVLNPVLLS